MGNTSFTLVTLGCAKNEIDSELMASILIDNNYLYTDEIEEAEIIIVNTCGFIGDAKEESINTILEVSQYKTQGRCKYLVLAGCLAERYSKELIEELPEVDIVIGTGNIKNILSSIEEKINNPLVVKKVGDIESPYLEGIKRISFNKTEYIRISEGCDNYCTFCIIPKLRGRHRSRTIDDIVNEAQYLADNGVEEIILIGQNTSDYGVDIYYKYYLHELLNRLNQVDKIKWIRILYLYPDNFTDDLIQAIKVNEKVLKYVDIPLQHISDKLLKMMNRNTSKEAILNLINKLRREIPGIVIRTTFIVGFPGESQEDFNELKDFVRDIRLNKIGAFTYSREEDTPAYGLKDQVSESLKSDRRNELMEVQLEVSENLLEGYIDKEFEVLVEEEIDMENYTGRTYMDSPEIDGLVYIETKVPLEVGTFVKVKIIDSLEYDLIGEVNQ